MSFSFPLLTVPIAIILVYVPHFMKVLLATRFGKYDNKDPRGTAKINELSTEKAALLTRLNSAHQNQLELLGVFAASVAANVARGKDDWQLIVLTALYIALRCAYIVLYAGPQVFDGYLRTFCFMGILVVVQLLWIKAMI